MEFGSKLIERAVNEVSALPGIGKKTALRLVLHLLKKEAAQTQKLILALSELKEKISYCLQCHYIAEQAKCNFCSSLARNQKLICVVEGLADVLAIENTGFYHGLYHVLGGLISPIEGVSPSELKIESLLKRLQNEPHEEVIFALSSTMEAETTIFYISKKIKDLVPKISSIARGVPVGGTLEYTDEATLGRSLSARVIYEV
jgi:recombination protein RecR